MSIAEKLKQGVREFIGLEPSSTWFDIYYVGEQTPENLRVTMSDKFLDMGNRRMRLLWFSFEQTQQELQNPTELTADSLKLAREKSQGLALTIQKICGINGVVIWQKLSSMRTNYGEYDHRRLVGTD